MRATSHSLTARNTGSSGGSFTSPFTAHAFSGGVPVIVELQSMIRFREDRQRSCFCSHNVPPSRAKQLFKSVLALEQMRGISEDVLRADVHRAESGRYCDDYGLALAVAMAASMARKRIDEGLLLMGDVGLDGCIHPASTKRIDRLNQAISAFEVETPLKVICSPESATWINASSTVTVIPVRTLSEAVEAVWPGEKLRPQ